MFENVSPCCEKVATAMLLPSLASVYPAQCFGHYSMLCPIGLPITTNTQWRSLASTKLHLYSQSRRCVTTFPVIITNSWSQTRDLLNTSPMPEPSRHRPLFSSPAQPVCFPKITPGYAGFPLGHPMKKPLKTDGARFFTGRMHFGHPVIQLTGHSTDT